MNEIHHYQVIIDLDMWSAFKKESQNQLDDLICKFKEKKLLANCGNVKLRIIQGTESEKVR